VDDEDMLAVGVTTLPSGPLERTLMDRDWNCSS